MPVRSFRRRKVVLFGGSFDPPHDGHLYVSESVRHALNADEVRWIPTLGNPLKANAPHFSFAQRMSLCKKITKTQPFVTISDIEKRITRRYSASTIRYLRRTEPGTQFFWMMGSDCVKAFHQWHEWKNIVRNLPIVIVSREKNFIEDVKASVFYKEYPKIFHRDVTHVKCKAPAAYLLAVDIHPASSTAVRAAMKPAFEE